MGKILYHGTNESAGKAILKDGFIDPKGTEIKYGDRKSSLRPQAGKVYMSHSIEYATIYAIGANMIGNEAWPSEQDIEKNGRYCYIFEFDQDDLTEENIHPDEDGIGEILHLYFTKNKENNTYDTSKFNSSLFSKIVALARDKLTGPQLTNLSHRFCEYSWFAKAGKKLMPYLTTEMSNLLIDMGAHTAHTGKAYIKRAYKFDRKKNKLLKSDASNIFELSLEVKVKTRKLKESFTFSDFIRSLI